MCGWPLRNQGERDVTMSESESQDPLGEFVLIVTIPGSAADRVWQLLLDAGIEPSGGGAHGVAGSNGRTGPRRKKPSPKTRRNTGMHMNLTRMTNRRSQRTCAGR